MLSAAEEDSSLLALGTGHSALGTKYHAASPIGSGTASRTNSEKRRDDEVFELGCSTTVIARFARVIAT